jgi:Protein of unknown function (DUF3263)
MDDEIAELSDRQRAMLDFERTWWQSDVSRDELIAARFGCSSAEYAADLAALLDLPAALHHDPLVVRRHLRRRGRRRSELRAAVTSRAADGTMHDYDGAGEA